MVKDIVKNLNITNDDLLKIYTGHYDESDVAKKCDLNELNIANLYHYIAMNKYQIEDYLISCLYNENFKDYIKCRKIWENK